MQIRLAKRSYLGLRVLCYDERKSWNLKVRTTNQRVSTFSKEFSAVTVSGHNLASVAHATTELIADWQLAVKGQKPFPIRGLE